MSGFSIKEIIATIFGAVVRETTPYVYAVIERKTNKWYIGCRCASHCHPNELGRTYFTSSKVLRPKFKATPADYSCKILYVGMDAPKKEREFLVLMSAKDNEKSYNMHNGCGIFDAKKAAELTVLLGVGAHARLKKKMSLDARKMVALHKPAKTGIFSKESREKCLATQKLRGVGIYNNEAKRRGALKSGAAAVKNRTGIHAKGYDKAAAARKMHLTKYSCDVCGLVGAATSIALHQKASKHEGRTKLT